METLRTPIAGREAKSAEKRLAYALAEKWKREYSEMVFYVRVRMSPGGRKSE